MATSECRASRHVSVIAGAGDPPGVVAFRLSQSFARPLSRPYAMFAGTRRHPSPNSRMALAVVDAATSSTLIPLTDATVSATAVR